MKYLQIPSVSKPVSRIVLGAAGGRFAAGEDVSDILEAALDAGINTVDTARVYGESEKALGSWLEKSGAREKVVLVTKGCHPSLTFLRRVHEKAAREDLEKSLDLLRTDHVEVYLLHRDDPGVPVGPIVEFLNRFHEEGLIGAFGGSNWSAARIAEANAYAAAHGLLGFSVTSPHYSLGRQRHDPWGNGCRTLTGEPHARERDWYRQTGMPVLAWSSVCNGVFSGQLKSADWGSLQKRFGLNVRWGYGSKDNRERLRRCEELAAQRNVTVAQITLAWLLNGELNVLPIVRASSPQRVFENAAAADLSLTEKEMRYLDLQAD